MTLTDHGLIIGKFHPPHAGHELLVRTAARSSRRVSVLVLGHPDEMLSVEERIAWLDAMVADLPHVAVAGGLDPHPIDYHDPAVWDLHEHEFRTVLATVTDEPVTAVFSSEAYGAELARRFDAVSVPVDPERALVPVSATQVREDPVAAWGHLPSPVRAGLCRRAVVIGAESTGTTTVARALTDGLRARGGPHGDTQWVPEVGRAWTVTKLADAAAAAALAGRPRPTMDELAWPTDDFVAIAERQNADEDRRARRGGPVLVCDTDAFATGIWHERYVGEASAAVAVLARHHPLYLVTHHDGVPFAQDGIRDGEHVRAWMTDRFLEALAATGRRTVVLRGSLDERVARAVEAVDELLAEGWDLSIAPPAS